MTMNQQLLNNLNPTQLAGISILALLAYREKTDISYQHREWGFWDIPEELIESLDNPGCYNQNQSLDVANAALAILNTTNAEAPAPTAK